ncbi:substrate-binding domain-containing protein [Edaphobacter albus]|uniref:substrate-binding domain-containing protein n=1 Tax=Edaphobacter sp. 4G125 TaxID=2763071 RepID=UPI0016444358|nr:substrate-binding domain-containing protein [Edaphobacter sp. 4G125]QNI36054.1 substrate-binding domain-containing protein [Edaphobacter sp. 4G125]
MAKTSKRLYLIPVLSKSLDILELLQAENKPMSLEAIHRRTRISKTTVYRVLKTLVHRGYLAQSPDGMYRHVMRPKKLRFGFGGQSADMPFSEEVTRSLREAAAASGVDLVELDNRYDAATAVQNAEEFIRSRVDLMIEFNVEQSVAAIIGDKVASASIPLIAIDIPHPNATYFGVDNYRVGVDAGEILARHAQSEWNGKVDWVVGLDLPEAGLLVQGRISGAFEAVRSVFPDLSPETFVRLDGRGMRDVSAKLVTNFLEKHPKDRHILIAAATDTSALGAVDAARRLKRQKHIAVVGQDCIAEALEEMKSPASPLVASISHETSTYGPNLMQLGLALLKGQIVPPYNYVSHKLVTRESLS